MSPNAGLRVDGGSGTIALHDPLIPDFMWMFDHYSSDRTGNLHLEKTNLSSGISEKTVMTFTPAGDVGIGMNPENRLDVNGNINTNQFLKVSAWTGHGSGNASFW